jgi:hypothetical protein
MRSIFILFSLLLLSSGSIRGQLTGPDASPKAVVGERIGVTDVLINYHRPGVKGREGKIWGGVVYKGFRKPFIGMSTGAPWRAGADENTTINFSTDVKIEGSILPAGTYGLFIAYDPDECTIIFSKDNSAWGSFHYDEKSDALRVKVKPQKLEMSEEWMTFKFINQSRDSATIALIWEKLMIPFAVSVDLQSTQLASLKKELISYDGLFRYQVWNQAAQFCLQSNFNLDEALIWTDQSLFWASPTEKFTPSLTKFQILQKLGRTREADSLMNKAVEKGTAQNLFTYAKLLKKEFNASEKSLAVHQLNGKKYPNEYYGLCSLTSVESARGNFDKATKYAKQALDKAPNPSYKNDIEGIIKMLNEKKDIN